MTVRRQAEVLREARRIGKKRLTPPVKLTNARVECDVEAGHCACGAFHTQSETDWRKKRRAVMDLAVEIEQWRRQSFGTLLPKTASQVWFVSHLLRLYFDQMDDDEAFREVVGDAIRNAAQRVSGGIGSTAPAATKARELKKARTAWNRLSQCLYELGVW